MDPKRPINNFKKAKKVELYPGMSASPRIFEIEAKETNYANGYLAPDTVIESVEVKAYNFDDTEVSSLVASSSVADNKVLVRFDYPDTGEGQYYLKIVATCDDSSVETLYFPYIYAIAP
jgi:hypothetical protein